MFTFSTQGGLCGCLSWMSEPFLAGSYANGCMHCHSLEMFVWSALWISDDEEAVFDSGTGLFFSHMHLTIYKVSRCLDTKMPEFTPKRANLGVEASGCFMNCQMNHHVDAPRWPISIFPSLTGVGRKGRGQLRSHPRNSGILTPIPCENTVLSSRELPSV